MPAASGQMPENKDERVALRATRFGFGAVGLAPSMALRIQLIKRA